MRDTMKKSTLSLLGLFVLLIGYSTGIAQGITLPSNSAAVTDDAISTLSNPAWLAARSGAELFLISSYTDATTFATDDEMGIIIKLGKIGFAGEFVNNGRDFYNKYTLSSGTKLSEGFYLGSSFNWYRVEDWEGGWNIGLGIRPLPFISAGAVAWDINRPVRNNVKLNPSYDLALALRPIGHRFTLSGDLLLTKDENHDYGEELDPRVRIEAMPVDGVKLMAEVLTDSKYYGFGLSLAMDNLMTGNFSYMDENNHHLNSAGYVQLSSSRHPNIFSPPSGRIVEITIGGEITEGEKRFLFWKSGKTLQQIRKQILHYAEDPRVDGLLITFEEPKWGLAQAQQIRRALQDFKATGKKLIAYSESYTQGSYYVATVCDEVYLMPVGFVELHGLAAVLGYWKNTLDKLGIGVQVVKVRDYKTAANMLEYEKPTNAESEMVNWMLDDIYNQLCAAMVEGRGWQIEQVKQIIDDGDYTSRRAVEAGVVDSLLYYDELTEQLKDENFRLTAEKIYWQSPEYEEEWPDIRTPKVAVIYVEGPIVSGESGSGLIGGDYLGSKTIAEAIRDAREDNSIDAIILRVNSPGGSAVASDVIYREVRRTVTDEKVKKPIVASMGNVAGSGGYYIACGADTIIAEEGTITGSIGVVGGKINLAGLHQKIYYNTHTFKRGEHSDAWRANRPFTDEEMEILQAAVEEIYDDFITRVAESRGLTKEEVNLVGEGRVWTGKQAIEKNLVDLIGGMDLALEVTRGTLGVEKDAPLQLEFYPRPKGFFSSLIGSFYQTKMKALPPVLQDALEPLVLAAEFYNGEPLMLMEAKIEVK